MRDWLLKLSEEIVKRVRAIPACLSKRCEWMKEPAEIPYYIDSMHSENYCKTAWGDQALVVLRRRGQSDIDSVA